MATSQSTETTPFSVPTGRPRSYKKCPRCGQSFTKSEHLARHIRGHTKEKPFSCKQCSKAYTRQDSLLRHVRCHNLPNDTSPAVEAAASALSYPLPPRDDGVYSVPGATHLSSNENGCEAREASLISTDTTCPLRDHLAGPSQSSTELWPAAPTNVSQLENTVDPQTGLMSTATYLDPSITGLDFQDPAWLAGPMDDFQTICASISQAHVVPYLLESSTAQCTSHVDSDPSRSESRVVERNLATAIGRNWYSRFVQFSRTHTHDESFSRESRVDDEYRERLSQGLRAGPSGMSLPSADFLNLCTRMYFARFNPVFPLVHAPSFRPSSRNTLLLLSICSIGALFIGSRNAVKQGREVFTSLNKAILASWEKYLGRDVKDILPFVQAAAIGQTFGMMTGDPNDLYMTESFHGTVIAWARHGGFFQIRNADIQDPTHVEDSTLEDTWRAWVHVEESIRLVVGLYIHDSEFSTTYHHEPILRHSPGKLPHCCSEELFAAPDAKEWRGILVSQTNLRPTTDDFTIRSTRTPTTFTSYAQLAGIVASIEEAKASTFDIANEEHFRNLLLSWHNKYLKSLPISGSTYKSLMIFWHAAFIALYADADLIERTVGRDGDEVSQQAKQEITGWAISPNAYRAVLHATLIMKLLGSLSLLDGAAIHVPKAVFYSGMVTYCYIKYNPSTEPFAPSREDLNVPELRVSELNDRQSVDCHTFPSVLHSQIDSSMLCRIIDLLRRISHWEVVRSFVLTLELLLDDVILGLPSRRER